MAMEVDQVGCMFNYVVTAQKPTAVSHAVVGHFTSPTDTNLITAKSTRIEIHTLSSEGLQGLLDVPIYGRISVLELFRPKAEPKDLLFILTEKYKFCILEYDAAKGELVTRANGDVRDSIGRPTDAGQIGIIDPDCRAIGLHLYDGMFKVIPLDERGQCSEAFNIRLEELSVIDVKFLCGCARPTLALLYEDTKHARHVKTYEVVIKDKDFADGPWSQQHVDAGSSLLIPVPSPLGGCLVVGEAMVTYLSATTPIKSVAMRQTVVTAYGRIDEDGSRYLLSDLTGQLQLLVLAHDGKYVVGLKLERVGEASPATRLCYLDSGVVFVGSRAADSQLVRLQAQPVAQAEDPTNFVEVLETFTNLGPIVDFSVVDLERQGQGQLVTCSGVGGGGSLRVVRNGIGLNEQAAVELPGIKGVWSLRRRWSDPHDAFLVLSFVGETRLLALNEADELDEAEVPGFEAGAMSIYCGTGLHDQLVQVTSSSVRVVDSSSQQLVNEWKPAPGFNINVAAGSPTQVLVGTGQGHLVYLELTPQGVVERGNVQLGGEIACLDISPLGEGSTSAQVAAVGTWSRQLLLLSVPGLAPLGQEELGEDIIPRSVLLASFEGLPYCLCGLGDGQLHTWRMDPASAALSDKKKVSLGTKPILLRSFRCRGASNVFAASDRPTIVYSSSKKLLYSNLNENEVNFMASFNSSSFPDSLAIAKEGGLTIGTIDDIQKLHIRALPLHEQPRRIVHQPGSRTFGVLTMALSPGLDEEQTFVRVLDDSSLDTLASLALEPHEMGCSLACCTLGSDPAEYLVVGTAFVLPEEPEPTRGRLLVLHYLDHKLHVVAEKEVKGAVYNVLPFQAKLLSSVNNKVQLYRWVVREDGAKEVQSECSHLGHVLALYLAARGDFIVVGDLMRSLSLIMYKAEEGALELRAQDYNSNWTTAIEMLDDDTYLAADNSSNLYVVRKNSDEANDEERSKLEVVGEYHVGEFINRFRRGSLVMRLPDSDLASTPTLLYGTIDGSIGMLASLPQPLFAWLSKLQDAMRRVVRGVGGLDHAQWRAFSNERRQADAMNFVDGDLIEMMLDLAPGDQAAVVQALGDGSSVEEVVRRVEELARLH